MELSNTLSTSQAISLLQRLISIPSVSRSERNVSDFLYDHLSGIGLNPSRVGDNIILGLPDIDPSKPTVLLNAHLDTVKPVSGWCRDPYTPVVEDGVLYGLGCSDCGGGLVSLLSAYTHLMQSPQPYNLIYAATVEEEVSGPNGMELLLSNIPQPDLAIVGEPTSLRMAVAEKGLMVLDCTSHGKAGHAARDEGDNAIYHAIDDILFFRDYRFSRVSPLLGAVKMSVTMIDSGTQHNVIPDTCRFVVDVRTNDCYTNLQVLQELSSQVRCDVRPRSTRLNSSHIDPHHPLLRRASQLGIPTFGSPTLSDQALMPFPSVKIGPGDSSLSHTADEHIRLSQIEEAVSLYIRLLDNLSLSDQ